MALSNDIDQVIQNSTKAIICTGKAKERFEELFDKYSQYVSDAPSDFEQIAGRVVLTISDFKKILNEL